MNSVKILLTILLFFCATITSLIVGVANIKATEPLFSPEGEWVIPGIKAQEVLEWSAVQGNHFFLKAPTQEGHDGVAVQENYSITKHTSNLLFAETSKGKEVAFLKLSDNALLYADGFFTDLLVVRRGMEKKTAKPQEGVWIEGNSFRKDRDSIDFNKHLFISGKKTQSFKTKLATDQQAFPGLTSLINEQGKVIVECVIMGDVLACRQAEYSLPDNPFIGFVKVEKQ